MEKQNVINRLNTGLKHEKLAYKIYGIVALVLAIIIMICGVVSAVAGAYLTANETSAYEFNLDGEIINGNTDIILGDNRFKVSDENVHVYVDGSEVEFTEYDVAILTGAGVIFVSMFYFVFGVILLAVAIVNLVMSSKIGKYRYSEVLTIKHASSVGSIIVAALFNEIALIFVIINFVYAKRNRAALEG